MNTESEITLRAIELEDMDFVLALDNEMELWNFGDQHAPLSRFALENYILTYDTDPLRAGEVRLIACRGKKRCGIIDIFSIDPYNHTAQIGIAIEKASRRDGIGRASLEAALIYCKHHLGLYAIGATVDSGNHGATALFEKCLFSSCGCLKGWRRDKDNGRSDMIIFQKIL